MSASPSSSAAGLGLREARRANSLPAIMAAAREIFVERGYHGASIRDIAARAGTSLSALYYWYPGKQDLLAALLGESRRDYLETCRRALAAEPADDPAAQLAALVRVTVGYRVRRRAESALSAQEWRHLEPRHLEQLDTYRVEAAKMWSTVVSAGVADGTFGCPYPDDARRSIQAACNAIADWYDPGGPVGTEELADRYVDIALRVVERRDSSSSPHRTNR